MLKVHEAPAEHPDTPVRAAQYVRMSTDHQKYSTQNQADAISRYADLRNITVVRTYTDEGKSGLTFDGRAGLNELITDVQTGAADYSLILVYDVSRWGRFQDVDESAYYEHVCKRAGICVQYCAEFFENDGSPMSTVAKSMKRAMAAEYSRELSAKVYAGQRRIVELGYRLGGPAGYGLRRMIVDQHGNPRLILKRGERKSIQTDRAILVPGPRSEVELVQWIFRAFVQDDLSERRIAEIINAKGILNELGKPWTPGTVHRVLINEKYIGNNVWNQTSYRLQMKRVRNRPESWICIEGAFEALVDPALFRAAQIKISDRTPQYTDDDMLDALRRLWRQQGILSASTIDVSRDTPCNRTYYQRFGSLRRAYELIGYDIDHNYRFLDQTHRIRAIRSEVIGDAVARIEQSGGTAERHPHKPLLAINGELRAQFVMARSSPTEAGTRRWKIVPNDEMQSEITVVVRLDELNRTPLDYFVIPTLEVPAPLQQLRESNGPAFDSYRTDTLNGLVALGTHIRAMEVVP